MNDVNRLFEDNFIDMLQKYPDAVNDKKKFIGLLKDYFPEHQMQVNLISNLFAMGIAEDIQNTAFLICARRLIIIRMHSF